MLLRGIILDENFYKFDNQNLLEPNNICLVQTTGNWELAFAKPLKQLLICVEDVIGNKYTVACNLDPDLANQSIIVTTNAGNEFYGYGYKYQIRNLALPTLVEEYL